MPGRHGNNRCFGPAGDASLPPLAQAPAGAPARSTSAVMTPLQPLAPNLMLRSSTSIDPNRGCHPRPGFGGVMLGIGYFGGFAQ